MIVGSLNLVSAFGGLGSGAWSLGYTGYTDNSANGYFASWICFCVSFAYMYMSIPQV